MIFFSRFLRSMYYHQKPNCTFINLICAMPVFLYMYPWKFSIVIFSNSVCSHLHDISEFKNLFMLSVRISSYGCTREVWRARKMRKSCTRR